MVLLRPQTLFAAFGKAMPRNAIGAKGVQIYAPGRMSWAKKALIIRNAPYTIEDPTPAQMMVRITFGRLAKEAKRYGLTKGLHDGLPGAASYIRDELPKRRDEWEHLKKPPEEWKSRQRRTFHTLEELEAMLKRETGTEVRYRYAMPTK